MSPILQSIISGALGILVVNVPYATYVLTEKIWATVLSFLFMTTLFVLFGLWIMNIL